MIIPRVNFWFLECNSVPWLSVVYPRRKHKLSEVKRYVASVLESEEIIPGCALCLFLCMAERL